MFQYCRAKERKSQRTTNETGILTWSAATVVGRWLMGTLELVLAARRRFRGGVEPVLRTPSPSQNRPCFLPCPTLMTISPSMSWVLGSCSGPWADLAADVFSLMRVWTLGFVYAWGGSSRLKETSDVALPLWAIANALKMEQGWPPCDADCEKNSKMIRNHAELSVRINK